jgi:hypothetical protein
MSNVLKSRELPLLVLTFFSVFTIADYYIKYPPLQGFASTLFQFGYVISIFTLGLGVVGLVELHLKKMKSRAKDWPFSVWTLVALLVTFVLGMSLGIGSDAYSYWFNNVYAPGRGAVSGLIIFFTYIAAFRGFRVKSIPSALMIIAFTLVLFRDAPMMGILWSGFPIIGTWLADVPTAAAFRAVIIGAGIGGIAAGIRTMLGYEKGSGGA